MKKLALLAIVLSVITNFSMAAEKIPLEKTDIDVFTSETQAFVKGGGDDHLAIAWWIPTEYWGAVFARDKTVSDPIKRSIMDTMEGVSLLAVVQADITADGAFKFYSKDEIEKNMGLSFVASDGTKYKLSMVESVSSDLSAILDEFKPILGAAMGNMGNNMHFYVINDTLESKPRLVNPYLKGKINIELASRKEVVLEAGIELPLNVLYVPRKCPNGKDAHISWQYCPWSGKKLEE